MRRRGLLFWSIFDQTHDRPFGVGDQEDVPGDRRGDVNRLYGIRCGGPIAGGSPQLERNVRE